MLLYGCESCSKNMEQKAEMWLWRKMMRISWTDKLANEVVLEKVGEERQYSRSIKDI